MTVLDNSKGQCPPWRPCLVCLGFLVALGLSLVAGCRGRVVTKPAGTGTLKSSSTDEALESARDIFRKEVGLKAYRNAIGKFNTFASRHLERRPEPLTDAQRDLLTNQVGLQEDELAEIGSATFTLLDGHYLDDCFLMRDAVRSLSLYELPPLQQVEKVFAWVMRQVRLQAGDREPVPAQFVLRRGWGTALERAFVFLDLVNQLSLDGCIVAYPADSSGQGFARFWLPGVLVDKDVYLFDTRLGLPLPSPSGQGIATLKEVRTHAAPFQPLALDDKHHYDVTPAQARQAELYLGWSLSALAPRMKFLEGELQPNNKVVLSKDPAPVLPKFKAAAGPEVRVRVAAQPGDPKNPLRLLRDFLPPGEGGTDKSNRKIGFEIALVPFQSLPKAIRRIPPWHQGTVMLNPQITFAMMFVQFPVPALRKDVEQGAAQKPDALKDRMRRGQDSQKNRDDRQDLRLRLVEYVQTNLSQDFSGQSFDHFLLSARSSRDDLLRGRYEEATQQLVESQEQVNVQKVLAQTERDLDRKVDWWSEEVQTVMASAKGPEIAQKLNDLWVGAVAADEDKDSPREPNWLTNGIPPWVLAILRASAEPLGEEATYLLALCKHEQAERAQARFERGQKNASPADAWKTADGWWEEYLKSYPSGPSVVAVRLNRAVVKAALNDRPAALALLRSADASGGLLEETGRLYRAKLLKEKK